MSTVRVQHRIEFGDAQSLAAWEDQLWIATRRGALFQLARDGSVLAEHALPVDPQATLVPATIGGPAALWTAQEAVMLVGDQDRLISSPVPDASAIPIVGKKLLRFAGPRLHLAAGSVAILPLGGRITGGCVILDGTALALLTERAHGRDLVLVTLASGAVLQKLPLVAGPVRIAPRRGLAVMRDGERRLVAIDLRQGRHLGTMVAADPVSDFAVDPDGARLAILSEAGALELVPLGDRLGAARRRSLAPPVAAAVAPVLDQAREVSAEADMPAGPEERDTAAPAEGLSPHEAETLDMGLDDLEPARPASFARHATVEGLTTEDASASKQRRPRDDSQEELSPPSSCIPLVDVSALEPRAERPLLGRGAALVELDREIELVKLWTLRAISRAWDTRRIGYGNEGHHPYEHEVAALVGRNAGFAKDYVEAAQRSLDEHQAVLRADPSYRDSSTPLAQLSAEFGLSPIAVDLLLVVAAPGLHGEVARLYGILGNDSGRALIDELLAHQILEGRRSRHDVEAELHPRAPLVRLGMLATRGTRSRPFAGLEVDPVLLARLRGEAPELGAALTSRAATCELDALSLAPGVLLSAIEAMARLSRRGEGAGQGYPAQSGVKGHAEQGHSGQGSAEQGCMGHGRAEHGRALDSPPARLALRGRAGSGRRALLAAFSARAGRSLGVIEASALPRDAERFPEALTLALRRAQLAGLIPAVHGLESVILDSRNGLELAREPLASHPGPLAVLLPFGTTPPLPLGHAVLDLPPLSETDRLAVWRRALEAAGRWLHDDTGLAARYRVGPGVIHRAIAALSDADPARPCDAPVDAFLRQSRDLRLSDHARRVERLASWKDLVLAPDILDSLRELVGRVRHRRTVFEQWGMSRTMATSRGLTALFQGQPGTGKTLVAGVIARELGLDLYQVDLSRVMSKWIGETERNLSTIFDAAEDGQVILLFDEADSLFAKRTEVKSSNDRYANLEVNYLLQRLDSFEGIAILTTNSGGSIDPAFKRRLSFRLSFPFPDEEIRAELWRAHLPPELPRGEDLTFDALARKYQLSGGYIRNACLRAAFLAAQEENITAPTPSRTRRRSRVRRARQTLDERDN